MRHVAIGLKVGLVAFALIWTCYGVVHGPGSSSPTLGDANGWFLDGVPLGPHSIRPTATPTRPPDPLRTATPQPTGTATFTPTPLAFTPTLPPFTATPWPFTPTPAAFITEQELRAILALYDWPQEEALAIAYCETGGTLAPWAFSGRDYGIFQVRYDQHTDKVARPEDLYNVLINVRVAYAIAAWSKAYHGWWWQPWYNCAVLNGLVPQ